MREVGGGEVGVEDGEDGDGGDLGQIRGDCDGEEGGEGVALQEGGGLKESVEVVKMKTESARKKIESARKMKRGKQLVNIIILRVEEKSHVRWSGVGEGQKGVGVQQEVFDGDSIESV
ncbi:uncharacterized protein J3R85_014701 [Psidium guajava]|nr:uncharacterized protein J3R85_014701 [Psidium guajava]